MSQGARTRNFLHRPYDSALAPRVASPDFQLERERSTSARVDAVIGKFCFVIVIAAMVALVVNAAFGGI